MPVKANDKMRAKKPGRSVRRKAPVKRLDDGSVPAAVPANEAKRLAALKSLKVLDSSPEHQFDDITDLAAHICDVPIALISLVDANRQWFKSRHGLEAKETPRRMAFCAYAILQEDLFVIPDAKKDPRFSENPLVVNPPHVRFYAGFPLRNEEGFALGTLCVIDHKPRKLTSIQLAALRVLGRVALKQLQSRQKQSQMRRQIDESRDSLAMANRRLKSEATQVQGLHGKLQDSEERLKLSLDAGGVGLWEGDLKNGRTRYDENLRRIIGAPEGVLEGDGEALMRVVHPEDRERVIAALGATLRGEGPYSLEHRILRPDGEVRWTVARGRAEFDDDGAVKSFRGAQFDVTAHREAEMARAAELRARASLASTLARVSDAFVAFDRDWNLIHANEKAAQLFGCSVGELLEKNFLISFPDLASRGVSHAYQRALDTQQPMTVEYEVPGKARWFENRIFPSPDGVSAYFHEITERKLAESKMRMSMDRQRALSRSLVDAQETEMRRLSAELHDRIGQNLTALRINLKLLSKAANSSSEPGRLDARIQESSEVLDSTVHSVRTMLKELRPAVLDDLGLVPALRSLGEDFSGRSGIVTTVLAEEGAERASADVELALYRIAQEALNNAAKYSAAKSLSIHVSDSAGGTTMLIADDGIGFKVSRDAEVKGSWGMDIMRERAELVHLRLRVESAPGQGTRISVRPRGRA